MVKNGIEKGRKSDMTKPRPVATNAMLIIDAATMANSKCIEKLTLILTNDLTKEGMVRAAGLALKEATEVQGKLTEVRYLGK